MSGPTPETGHAGHDHERTDVRTRPVALAFVALAAVLVVLGGLGGVLVRYYAVREAARSAPESVVPARQLPPEPRIQARPVNDLRALRAAEARLLTEYGWVDRPRGIVRIPIDEAMRLLVTRRGGGR